MSGVDLFENVLDRDAAVRTLYAFMRGEQTFEAAGLVRLWCGHVRPTNRWVEAGDRYECLICGPQTVERLDLIEPTVFPVADALRDDLDALPEVGA